jgi:hypothetical protein
LASERLVCVPGLHPHDLYLANGARFYVDAGDHPEMCTPECSDPKQLVGYLRAGERIVAELLDELCSRRGRGTLQLYRCNVDYAGSRSTWGSHESYRFVSNPREMFPRLVSHLVSRVVYTGAGGFDPHSAGLSFTLSPRAWHLAGPVVPGITHVRGLIHARDECLGPPDTHRLHVTCGENLCSDVATYLRIGATALMITVLDMRPDLVPDLDLADPMGALHRVASDPDWRRPLELRDGSALTAVEIQKTYCAAIREARTRIELPPWTDELCDTWWGVLDWLDHDPAGLAGTLDWIMKRTLFTARMRERDCDRVRMETWTSIVDQLASALFEIGWREPVSVGEVRDRRRKDPRLASVLRPSDERIAECGLTWDEMSSFLELRDELMELDLRFGQLGASGLCERLERSGCLAHRMVSADEVTRAMREPPTEGRARRRGRGIAEVRDRQNASAGWNFVRDPRHRRILELEDPLQSDAEWVVATENEPDAIFTRLRARARQRGD